MVLITDTSFRDAHQSLLATRMRTRDMLPICEKMDRVGFFSMEIWGGATFDSCIRFLNEDPWERLRSLKEALPNTKMQMLLRGQNLVGYRHYSDDVVEQFVVYAAQNGVDIFRIFDAVNDIRNMKHSIEVALREGAHVQGTVCYTISPVHTIDKFVEMAVELESLGCHSICIKDMAGLISPPVAYNLVSNLKDELSTPINLHSHCTSGMAPMAYYAACSAGVDIIDTAMSPLAWGTSQPPTETIVAALRDTKWDTGLDLVLLQEIKKYFEEVREKYLGILDPISERIDTDVLLYQIPGGMLSNLVAQLKEQNALDKWDEVLAEMPNAKADLGHPPLVTPTSQIVGMQAVLNVILGEKYKMVPKEVRDYVKGLYGMPPAQINPEVQRKILEDEEPITCRPADLLEPELGRITQEAEEMGILQKPEDVITYALYPQVAPKFLRGEIQEEPLKPPVKVDAEPKGIPTEYTVEIEGDVYEVKVVPKGGYIVAGEAFMNTEENVNGAVKSSMQGLILEVRVEVGQEVEEGETVAILEAMKMAQDVHAPHPGTVREIRVNKGDTVAAGDVLMVID